MKKFSVVLALAVMMALLCACGVTGWDSSNASSQAEAVSSSPVKTDISDENYEDSLSGLVSFLKDAGAIAGDTETMQAAMIGAKDGVRYTAEKYVIELYEYDLANLSETAQETLASVRENGTFSLLGFEAKAVLSGSGKYLMVFTESDSEASIAEAVRTLFDGFKK